MTEGMIDQALKRALAHYHAGRLLDAEQLCRQILAVQPQHSETLNLLGTLFHRAGSNDHAIALIRRAIAINPQTPAYHSNLGNLLRLTGHLDEAIAAYHHALALQPTLAEVYSNLGSVLAQKHQLDHAIAAYETAIRLNPRLVEAHSNLGNARTDQGQIDLAIAAYRAALALQPNHPEVHCNLGMCLLLQGDYASGWPEYEWRRKCDDAHTPPISQPQWQGENLSGRTLLLHAEQGLGDTIQFIRFAPLLAQTGAKIILSCQPELLRLLQQIPGITTWIPQGQSPPAFDLHYPLLSLPLALGTTLQNIPPYPAPLHAPAPPPADPPRLGAAAKRKVGLVWAGSPHHKNDRNRSLPLSSLDPLQQLANIQFFSLQKGPAATHIKGSPWEHTIIDTTANIHDLADTAALIAQLDLIISVDTAVAHLAAAMHKPVWLLLPFAPDWRWLLHRSDSPWYPTIRLFRQNQNGDWSDVIQRITAELATMITQH